jgi:hypothetical protein
MRGLFFWRLFRRFYTIGIEDLNVKRIEAKIEQQSEL